LANYEVTAKHEPSFPYAMKLGLGDKVTITDKEEEGWIWCTKGKTGVWIPKTYISRQDHTATMLIDYDSTELDVSVGEQLKEITVESGWMLCINAQGQRGWIPATKVKKL
jgi:hypothetical protein